MRREKTKRSLSLFIAIVVMVATAAVCSLAMGFFVIPCALLLAAGALFYWALRHQGVRNPLAPLDLGPSGTYADGEPLDRSLEHQTQARAAEDALRLDDEANEAHHRVEDAEREEVSRHTDPRDFQGPPPFVPFP